MRGVFGMNRASYGAYNRQRQKHHTSRARKIVRIILILAFLAVLLACGKFLIDKDSINDLWDISPTNKADTWNLILVNRWHTIPDDYEVDLTQLSNGQSVDTRIYPSLQAMFDAARADGIYPVVASGYRTAEYQQSLLDEKIKEYKAQGYSAAKAQELAEVSVAVAGTSEHQLGIAVDINADPDQSTDDEVYEWLHKNSYKYGFILRYPSDKTDITGTIYEPWHYRYVGVDAATEIYTQGICLEEYLENIKH
jgi:D-alanyl-D-alanine carboxypeptidase